MRKSRKLSRRDESVVQILTEYFGCDYFPTGQKELRIELFENDLFFMPQISDSAQGIKKLLSLFAEYHISKSKASDVCLKCWWVIQVKMIECFYTEETRRIFELQTEIVRAFERIETLIATLKKLAEEVPKPVSYSHLVNSCTNLGIRIAAAKGDFKKVAQPDVAKFLTKTMKQERPSGQKSAHTNSFRKKITELIDVIHDDIKTKGKTAQSKKTWKDEKEGFTVLACRRAFEILRCFGIDMKSADNLRKSYEKWSIKPHTNK